jgi:hypothetical protein
MFCCETCKYKSNRKFNLQKHIKNVHSRDATDNELTIIQITAENSKISTNNSKITADDSKITAKNSKITAENSKITADFETKISFCKKCSKKLKSFQSLKRHEKICKGVSNPLECHYCHRIFTTQQAKCKHLKICKIKEVHKLVETHVVNNNTQYNNVTNNYIINNYNSRNNLCNDFETQIDVANVNDFGSEDISYINSEKMKTIALGCDFKTLIYEKHFHPEHPENHNILNNCQKSYKVLKDNKWNIESKEYVHSTIYINTKVEIYDCAFHNDIYEYLTQWQEYEEKHKKRLSNYIDIQIKEMTKKLHNNLIVKSKELKTDNIPITIQNGECEKDQFALKSE